MPSDNKAADLLILKDEDGWPNWPVMPLVKRGGGGWPQSGFIVAGNGPTIFEKNMFELVTGPIADQVKDCPQHKFDSFEALLEAGWEVD